jgi:hypothetical protein
MEIDILLPQLMEKSRIEEFQSPEQIERFFQHILPHLLEQFLR